MSQAMITMPVDLRRIEAECRAELKPIMDEMTRIHATSIRPMWLVNGKLEYGQYPAPIQAYLDELLALGKEIVERHKARATPVELRTKEEM